jgi:short-subunit dehydrogenase
MDRFFARTVEHFGRLDVMICNAGFGIYGTIDQIAAADMRRLMDVNYMGTYHAARAALPVFRRQAAGHVVIISSIVGKRGVPYVGAYAATKFAQVGLAECLRAELVGTDIHVTVVYPISTETEFFQVMTRESGHATRAAGPRQSAERVADAIARAIERPTPEVYPYRLAKWLAIVNAVAPGLSDRLVKRWGRKPT